MNKNLGWKLIVIAATLLIFLFGIFGIPKDWSGKGLIASLQDRIHLGLDLKGGTHLILQVQVNDAVNVETDNAVERLKADLNSHKIHYDEISKPDPTASPDKIVLKGIPPEATGDLRNVVGDRLPEYDLASGANNTWTVAMKPQSLADLKNRAVAQAIETIRNRIDQLGVSEPVIQEHGLGEYQILVQLPGVDDPARVKEIMQSTAMLEIRQSLGGPYPSEHAALQDKGGILPPDTQSDARQERGQPERRSARWYLSRALPRSLAAICAMRRAVARRKRQPVRSLQSDRRRRTQFCELHRRARGRQSGCGARQQGEEVANIKEADSRYRNNQRPLHRAGGQGSVYDSALGRAAGGD